MIDLAVETCGVGSKKKEIDYQKNCHFVKRMEVETPNVLLMSLLRNITLTVSILEMICMSKTIALRWSQGADDR